MTIIGLVPAGGRGTRIAPLPLSKELYPVGFEADVEGQPRAKVVCHYLLEKMQSAGATQAFLIVRPGKWDIPDYFGDGSRLGMNLAYLTVHVPFGVPYTLNQAFPFVREATILFGFPDILFEPRDAFSRLLHRQRQTQADVVLGLFPTEQFHKVGMVDVAPDGRVHTIIEKPTSTTLKYMWAIAIWSPTFTHFMSNYISRVDSVRCADRQSSSQSSSFMRDHELPIGDVIQAAITEGLHVNAEIFPEGMYIDIGTPHDLARAVRLLTQVKDSL